MKLVSIGKASEILGLSQGTLRKYAKRNLINTVITEGGHRRFDVHSFVAENSEENIQQIQIQKKKFPKSNYENKKQDQKSCFRNAS